jgi:hypothetical protein
MHAFKGSSLQLQRGLLFWATALCGFISAHQVLQLSSANCPLGVDLHTVLVLKVSALPASWWGVGLWCSTPALGSAAWRNVSLQTFLHVFCCFSWFRFRQRSAPRLWSLRHDFPLPAFATFLWVCEAVSKLPS